MAQAAKDVRVKFGYLHVVSDNLVEEGGENLSNENREAIYSKRELLYREIENILRKFIAAWGTQPAGYTAIPES